MRITGKCHCGNVAFTLEWKGDPTAIPARACTCSFCRKHGGVWTSDPRSKLEVAVRDASRVAKYEFGTGTAEFQVCSVCGVVPLVTCQIEHHVYAAVNVNTFENVEQSLLWHARASFDGEDVESRLARRKRNWIAEVRFGGRPHDRDR